MADWIQQNFPDIYRIGMQGVNSWPDAIYATLYMTVISFIIGGLLGLVMGLFLVLTGPRGVIENKFVFQILDKRTIEVHTHRNRISLPLFKIHKILPQPILAACKQEENTYK